MNIKETILDMYLKGHTIDFIVISVYRLQNNAYFNDFHKNKIISKDKYHYMKSCRHLVEKVILDYTTKQRTTSFINRNTNRALL